MGTELLISSYDKFSFAPNVLATCAFNVINDGFKAKPDTFITNVLNIYYKNIEVKNILITDPYLWDIEILELDDVLVGWLLCIPVSDNEMNFAKKYGVDKLTDELEGQEIDAFDFDRKSIF